MIHPHRLAYLLAFALCVPVMTAYAEPPKPAQPATPAEEPLFRRKPVSYWLPVLGDALRADTAAEALAALAPESLPGLTAILESADDPLWLRAAEALRQMGPAAAPAAPQLAAGIKVPARRDAALAALLSIGGIAAAPAAPVLAERLRDADKDRARDLLRALEGLGPHGAAAIPALLARLQTEKENWTREHILDALAAMGPAAEPAMPALEKLINEYKPGGPFPESLEREFETDHALTALGKIGPAALPRIVKFIREGDDLRRTLGLRSLAAMGAPAFPTILEMLKDPDVGVRAAAAGAVARLGKDAPPAVAERLLPMLADETKVVRLWGGHPWPVTVRYCTACALVNMGARATEAARALLEEAESPDTNVAGDAERMLEGLRPDPAAVAPAINAMLGGSDEKRRMRAVRLCGQWRTRDGVAAALEELLKSADAEIRAEAAGEHWRFTGKAEPAAGVLIRVLAGDTAASDAADELRKMGESARPALVAALGSSAEPIRGRVARLLLQLDPHAVPTAVVADWLASEEASDRSEAAQFLARQGVSARSAVPDLIRALADKEDSVRAEAALALGQIGGAKSAAALARIADDKDPLVQMRVGQALRALKLPEERDGDHRPAAELIRALGDPDDATADYAAQVLARRPAEARAAIPRLIRALRERKEAYGPALALAAAGGADALAALVEALAGGNAQRHEAAAYALEQMGPAAKDATAALGRLMNEKAVWPRAGLALAAIDPAAAAAHLPFLTEQLNDVNAKWAALIIGRIGPAAKYAAAALTACLNDRDPDVCLAAARALLKIGAPTERATARLVEMLGADPEFPPIVMAGSVAPLPNAGGPAGVLELLKEFGPAARSAVPALVKRLERDRLRVGRGVGRSGYPPLDPPMIDQYAEILGRIGPAAAPAVPALTALLKNPSPEVRVPAALALWRITFKADPAVAALVGVAEGRDMAPDVRSFNNFDADTWRAYQRFRAVEALGEIADTRAMPALTALLRFNYVGTHEIGTPRRRAAAAAALGRLGSSAAPAVPMLIERLEDPGYEVRRAAAEALGRIGPAAGSALPALLAALRDPDARLSRAAAAAVAAVIGR